LRDAIEENQNLQKEFADLMSYTNNLDAKLVEIRNFFSNLGCSVCGHRFEVEGSPFMK
jgi:transcription elongation factor Elf1